MTIDTRRLILSIPGESAAAQVLAYNQENRDVVRGAFQACYMGYSLAHNLQGRGYMTEAARAGISYMFDTAMLHSIMANYVPENARSAALLERLGFVVEGTARNYLFIAGAWRDHVLTSLTNPSEIIPAF